MIESGRDRLFADSAGCGGDGAAVFAFDASVAAVFPDMIRRSVPGYADLVTGTGMAAAEFAKSGTRCYDLGCSRGASSFSVAGAVHAAGIADFEVVSVDNSPAMIERLRDALAREDAPSWASFIRPLLSDALDVEISNASVVVMNYTLQFVPIERRQDLIEGVFDGLVAGGALILSEKVVFDDSAEDALASRLHDSFKRANGYSEMEIAKKRAALENVLVPETIDAHIRRLERVGFKTVWRWFQALNFVSFIAVKEG